MLHRTLGIGRIFGFSEFVVLCTALSAQDGDVSQESPLAINAVCTKSGLVDKLTGVELEGWLDHIAFDIASPHGTLSLDIA